MRIINGLFCAILLGFAVVQINDPDTLFWMPIYLIPAAWAGLAAIRPQQIGRGPYTVALTLCIGAAIFGTVWFWPSESAFWRQDVWWESETAREGMGCMIVTAALLLAALSGFLSTRRAPSQA